MNKVRLSTGVKQKKYGNIPKEVDGVWFGSTKEAEYYSMLMLAKRAINSDIERVERQVNYRLEINGVFITSYRADFVIYRKDGSLEVVDVKGFRTNIYKMKKKLMKAILGIEIKEV